MRASTVVSATIATFALFITGVTFAADAEGWASTTWNGEQAYESTAGDWRAIVSEPRARLVYFGTRDGEHNLLFASATRHDPAGWGGHRLWLGPQVEWPGGWPPAKAWEASAATRVDVDENHLRLRLGESGDGWPELSREYYWQDTELHCAARTTGGRRAAQIIQIMQVPPTAEVFVRPFVTPSVPQGYVQVHLGRGPSPQPNFPTPPHVSVSGEQLCLRFLNRTEKLAFRPQTLVARIGGFTLQVQRGISAGKVRTVPDEGFLTQVYLGSRESQLIELEQLSAQFADGGDASFEIVMSASRSAPETH